MNRKSKLFGKKTLGVVSLAVAISGCSENVTGSYVDPVTEEVSSEVNTAKIYTIPLLRKSPWQGFMNTQSDFAREIVNPDSGITSRQINYIEKWNYSYGGPKCPNQKEIDETNNPYSEASRYYTQRMMHSNIEISFQDDDESEKKAFVIGYSNDLCLEETIETVIYIYDSGMPPLKKPEYVTSASKEDFCHLSNGDITPSEFTKLNPNRVKQVYSMADNEGLSAQDLMRD